MNTKDIKDEEVKNTPEVEKTTTEATAEINTPAEETTEDLSVKEKDKCLRLFAEFKNYEKRTAKERAELFKTVGQDTLSTMLPTVDDFDRALAELSKSSNKNTLMGVELVYNRFMITLKQGGLEKMEVAPNDVFDSGCHDAVTQIPASTPDAKGKTIDVVQTGYKSGDRIICFPKAVVAQQLTKKWKKITTKP